MVSRQLLESLADFDAPLLANTLDYIDSTPQAERYMSGDIHSVTPGLGPTVGLAVTCQIDSSTPQDQPDMDPFWQQLKQMQQMELPSVWVVQAVGSRPDHECILGDGMGKLLYAVGCLGSVTNGRVRDIAGLLSVPFAVYCPGTAPHHCAVRVKVMDEPVVVGGITIQPGDIIHASQEGVIKIPTATAKTLLEKAPDMRAAEHEIHTVWRQKDVSLQEKRQHALKVFTQYGFIKDKAKK